MEVDIAMSFICFLEDGTPSSGAIVSNSGTDGVSAQQQLQIITVFGTSLYGMERCSKFLLITL